MLRRDLHHALLVVCRSVSHHASLRHMAALTAFSETYNIGVSITTVTRKASRRTVSMRDGSSLIRWTYLVCICGWIARSEDQWRGRDQQSR